MMIMRPSRELLITRFNNKHDGWLIIIRQRGNLLFIFSDHGCPRTLRCKGCRYAITSLSFYILAYFVVVQQCFSRFFFCTIRNRGKNAKRFFFF
jgi:hypothetical protein